jgi:O-antigen/teichoic acid export membrane protein
MLAQIVRTLVFRILAVAAGVIISVCLARFLGPEGRGAYAIFLSFVSLTTIIACAGTPEASVCLLGKQTSSFQTIVRANGLWAFAVGFPLILIFAYGFSEYAKEKIPLGILFVVIASVALLRAVSTHIRYILLGVQNFTAYNILATIETVGLLLFLLGLATVGSEITLPLIVIAFTGNTTVVFLISIVFLAREKGYEPPRVKCSRSSFGSLTKLGPPIFVVGLASLLMQRMPIVWLEHEKGLGEAGVYAVAAAIPMLFANIPNIVSLVFFPKVARETNRESAAELCANTVRITLLFCLVACIPMIMLSRHLVVMLYGDQFLEGVVPLNILMFSASVGGVGSILYNYFAGSGNVSISFAYFSITLVVFALSGYFLVPIAGAAGAAGATLLGQIGGTFVLARAFQNSTGSSVQRLMISRKDFTQIKLVLIQTCKRISGDD